VGPGLFHRAPTLSFAEVILEPYPGPFLEEYFFLPSLFSLVDPNLLLLVTPPIMCPPGSLGHDVHEGSMVYTTFHVSGLLLFLFSFLD